MPNYNSRLGAQLRSAAGRSSKLIKDAEGIEAVVQVPGRGTLTLSVRKETGTPCAPVPGRTPGSEGPRAAT